MTATAEASFANPVPPSTLDDAALAHRFADVGGGVRLHYVEAGEASRPLVVLLHGFPEFWYAWRRQIPALARAGFRVVAPDMRGYNLSDKPRGVRRYGVRTLVEDVAALVRACGAERASIVGHDWGAGVAWSFAMVHPELLDRLVVLNGPHPARMLRGLLRPKQLVKSWYMFFFQLPWLPEALMRGDHFAFALRAMRDEPLRPGAFTDADLARYADALAQPRALTASIDYYRAMTRPGTTPPLRRIDAPTLIVWGDRDEHLSTELARPDPADVPNARLELLPASHWVQHEQPEKVNALLVDFLRGGS